MYFALVHGEPSPASFIEWRIVFDTGWTLDEVRSMSVGDLHDYLNIKDGMAKARGSLFNKPPKR